MVLISVASVLGTLAYLTSEDTIVNTFTVGKVNIVLNETAVTPDGKAIDGADRVKTNNYHLVPGKTYTKDPTLTVVKGSEEAYVRMFVTFNCLKELDAVFAPGGANMLNIFNGYDANNWVYTKDVRDDAKNTVTYEFRYKETVEPEADKNAVLDALFDSITIPSALDGKDMESISGFTITVTGNAIQAGGFNNANDAWTAFDGQING
jgi:predicted ribosomally synthesized peptide with SipW-like signal peptide